MPDFDGVSDFFVGQVTARVENALVAGIVTDRKLLDSIVKRWGFTVCEVGPDGVRMPHNGVHSMLLLVVYYMQE